MISTREYLPINQEQELQDEIDMKLEKLKRYTSNIDSLLGKERSSEVKKAMINFLVEQL